MAPKKKTVDAAAKKKEEEEKAAAEKRKATEEAEAPAAKKAKKDEEEVEEDGAEKEKDAASDKRPNIKPNSITFEPFDTTLNVVPAVGGKMLMSLSEGGMQYLIAGARASLGMKSGRYMFEVKIVEALNPSESSAGGGRPRAPTPRQLVRIGFSTAKSPLVLGESEEHVCFDSEGFFWCGGKKKNQCSSRFSRDQVIAAVLNLEPDSPNYNTISLFCEGLRISEPQPLPDNLKGKCLYPHLSFRNVTVQVLTGKEPAKALPFKCRSIGGAAAADTMVAPKSMPKDGKFEVLLPIAFPDEGTFDWLDNFLAKNPNYVELSDRKILEWAALSGLWKPKATGWKNSNDKPEFNFGLPGMDDFSVRRIMNSIAAVVPRNYVVMEVKSNLVEAERKEVCQRFAAAHFKKVAHVVMGEPSEEFKSMQLEKFLKEKQEKADIAWKAKKAEEARKKQIEQRQKQLQEQRKKAEEARKKVAEEARKKSEKVKKEMELKKLKADREKKAGEVEKKKESGEEAEALEALETALAEVDAKIAELETEEPAAEEPKEEETKDEEEEKKDDAMEVEEETEPPKVELTDEEKKMWFRAGQGGVSDLTNSVLNASFAQFSIPEKHESFDAIRYEWQQAEPAKEYLRKWVLEKKKTARIEDLEPGEWFKTTSKDWQTLFSQWQAKQKTFKASAAQKAREAKAKAKAEGEDAEMEEEDPTENLDILAVEDVADVGGGVPLFKDFAFEDWALLQLRMEMYLLKKGYSEDVDDSDRPGISETHFPFYYNRYFKKTLVAKHFGVTTNQELVQLVKDVVSWDDDKVLTTDPLDEDVEDLAKFLKITEECRRERQRRIDAGDETARLKFSPMAIQTPSAGKLAGPAGAAGGVRPPAFGGKAMGKGAGAPGTGVFPPSGVRPPLAGGRWQPQRR